MLIEPIKFLLVASPYYKKRKVKEEKIMTEVLCTKFAQMRIRGKAQSWLVIDTFIKND